MSVAIGEGVGACIPDTEFATVSGAVGVGACVGVGGCTLASAHSGAGGDVEVAVGVSASVAVVVSVGVEGCISCSKGLAGAGGVVDEYDSDIAAGPRTTITSFTDSMVISPLLLL